MEVKLLTNDGYMIKRDAKDVGKLADHVYDMLLRRAHRVLDTKEHGPDVEQAWMMDDKLKELRRAVSQVNKLAEVLKEELHAQLQPQS